MKIFTALSLLCFFGFPMALLSQSEGEAIYQVISADCEKSDAAPQTVKYHYKDGLHRIEEIGGSQPMIYFYSDGSPYRTVCFKWMGHALAIQEKIQHDGSINGNLVEDEPYLKHICASIENSEATCLFALDIEAGHPWMKLSDQKALAMKFSSSEGQSKCAMEMVCLSHDNQPQEEELFVIPEEFEFIKKEQLGSMFGEMSSN